MRILLINLCRRKPGNIKSICLGVVIALITLSCSPAYIEMINYNSAPNVLTANQNFMRTGYQEVTLDDSLELSQEESLRGLPYHSLLSYSNHLMFITHNGFLYFIDHDDFENISNSSLSDGITVAPSVSGSLLFAAVSKGKTGLIAYDILNGNIVWSKPGRYSQSAPVIFDSLVIHATLDGRITAFDKLKGERKWENQQDDKIVNSLALFDQNLIVATQNGVVRNYNVTNGSLNWSLDLDNAVYATPVVNSDHVFIAAYDGTIYQIDLHGGNRITDIELGTEILQTPALDEDNIFIPLADGTIVSLSKSNLKINWKKALDGPSAFAPLLIKNELIAGTTSKRIYRLKKENGALKQMILLEGRPRTQPLIIDQKLYVGYESDYIAAFTAAGDADE